MRPRILCALLLVTASAACNGKRDVEPAARRPGARLAVGIAPVSGVDEPVTIEATGSFPADESPTSRPRRRAW